MPLTVPPTGVTATVPSADTPLTAPPLDDIPAGAADPLEPSVVATFAGDAVSPPVSASWP